ncbi:taspase [Mactra antiquata]
MSPGNTCLIAVHAGAGYHAVEKSKQYRSTCAEACTKAMACLKSGGSALDAITIAVKYLEDSPILNAGTGSSLNLEGMVECDASLMDGQTLKFGAVGAISEVQNPVLVARKLIDEQKTGYMSLGRIPPCTMVGKGATNWAVEHGIPRYDHENLITGSSEKTYKNHKRRLEKVEYRRNKKRLKYRNKNIHNGNKVRDEDDDNIDDDDDNLKSSDINAEVDGVNNVDDQLLDPDMQDTGVDDRLLDPDTPSKVVDDDDKLLETDIQDTVGAVCIDINGNVAAGVSSGGISLKQTGRLGPAALYGAGCWATNWQSGDKPGIAVATSGTGEYIMKTLLARQCAESMRNDKMAEEGFRSVFVDKFLGSEFLQDIPEKYGGILALKLDIDGNSKICDLLWGHTTNSMCIGYMTDQSKPKTIISRLDEDKFAGQTLVMEGTSFIL